MKLLIPCLIMLFFAFGCENRRKQEAIDQRVAELNQKEQELLFKEKTLQLKEQELIDREAKIESLNTDTASMVNREVVGNWSVKMSCIETTCTGYAVGDTKNEVWDISYQGNNILAKAMAGHQLARIYSGRLRGNTVELAEGRDSTGATPGTMMFVRLSMINEKTMEGRREIVRENDCKVVYALELVKQ